MSPNPSPAPTGAPRQPQGQEWTVYDPATGQIRAVHPGEHFHPLADAGGDMNELAELCLAHLKPPKHGGSWTLNPVALATAIIAAGWVKTPC